MMYMMQGGILCVSSHDSQSRGFSICSCLKRGKSCKSLLMQVEGLLFR